MPDPFPMPEQLQYNSQQPGPGAPPPEPAPPNSIAAMRRKKEGQPHTPPPQAAPPPPPPPPAQVAANYFGQGGVLDADPNLMGGRSSLLLAGGAPGSPDAQVPVGGGAPAGPPPQSQFPSNRQPSRLQAMLKSALRDTSGAGLPASAAPEAVAAITGANLLGAPMPASAPPAPSMPGAKTMTLQDGTQPTTTATYSPWNGVLTGAEQGGQFKGAGQFASPAAPTAGQPGPQAGPWNQMGGPMGQFWQDFNSKFTLPGGGGVTTPALLELQQKHLDALLPQIAENRQLGLGLGAQGLEAQKNQALYGTGGIERDKQALEREKFSYTTKPETQAAQATADWIKSERVAGRSPDNFQIEQARKNFLSGFGAPQPGVNIRPNTGLATPGGPAQSGEPPAAQQPTDVNDKLAQQLPDAGGHIVSIANDLKTAIPKEQKENGNSKAALEFFRQVSSMHPELMNDPQKRNAILDFADARYGAQTVRGLTKPGLGGVLGNLGLNIAGITPIGLGIRGINRVLGGEPAPWWPNLSDPLSGRIGGATAGVGGGHSDEDVLIANLREALAQRGR